LKTSGDEFGIRPMPGITNVVINSRSTTSVGLKGLRECTISIKCHSLAQLQAIEILYMRPGYTALLEWGHSVYFNSSDDDPQQNITYIDIFSGGKTRFDVYDEIYKKKIESNGNYDAILGKVNNFSWTADDNGGYDITVNIISMNDIIDSLKINQVVTENNGNAKKDKKDPPIAENALSYVFRNILLVWNAKNPEKPPQNVELSSATSIALAGTGTAFLGSPASQQLNESTNKLSKKNDAYLPQFHRQSYTWKNIFGESDTLKRLMPDEKIPFFAMPLQINKNETENVKLWNLYFKFEDVIKFINSACIPFEGLDGKNKVVTIKNLDKNDVCRSHPAHISVDPYVCLIEPSFLGVYGSGELAGEDIEKRDQTTLEELLNNKKILDTNLFNPSSIGNKIKELRRAFGPYGFTFKFEETISGVVQRFIEDGFQPGRQADSIYEITITNEKNNQIYQATAVNADTFIGTREDETERSTKLAELKQYLRNNANATRQGKTEEDRNTNGIVFQYGTRRGDAESPNLNLMQDTDFKFEGKGKNRYKARTKDFLINVQYIIDTADKSQDSNGDVFLKDFMINLFRGIEQATGQVNNFALTPYEGDFDDDGNPIDVEVVRIIDEDMMDASFESRENYYEFPILKYNSLVTDYKLSSTISNAISTTVSIAAQNVGAGHAATGENSVFNAFNQGIKDRLAQPIIDQVNNPRELKLLDSERKNNLRDSLYYISNVLEQIKSNAEFTSDTSTAKKLLADYINYSTTNKPASNKLFYSFTPFPLTLNLTIDGISGIAVGSIIRLPVDRLPLLYRYLDPEAEDDSFNQAKVAFVIFGVDHTVDDRGWFTNLTCQMVMMPRQSDADKAEDELKGNTKVDSSDKTVVDDEKPLDWDEDGGDDGEKKQGRNLPFPKSQPGSALDPSKVKYIVVHCTANGPTSTFGVKEIRNYHLSLGWDDIGYHYIIKRDGTIEKGRDISRTGAHTYGYNSESVGVSYVGGIDNNENPEDNRTLPQKQSLTKILTELKQKFPNAIIQGHRDFAGVAKACPSFDAKTEYQNIA
jgi:N-acetylmuramoyl-L-alanine amidase